MGCAGHEACAVLNRYLTPEDWLTSPTTGQVLMLARGLSAEEFFHQPVMYGSPRILQGAK